MESYVESVESQLTRIIQQSTTLPAVKIQAVNYLCLHEHMSQTAKTAQLSRFLGTGYALHIQMAQVIFPHFPPNY